MSVDYFATSLRDPKQLARLREGERVDEDRPLPPNLAEILRQRTGLRGDAPRLAWDHGRAWFRVFLGETFVEVSHGTGDPDASLDPFLEIVDVLQRAGLHVWDPQQGKWLDCVPDESKRWSVVLDPRSHDEDVLDALDALGTAYLKDKLYAHAAAVTERAVAMLPDPQRLRDLSTALNGLPDPDHPRRTQLCLNAHALSGWWGDLHNASIAAGQAGDREREIAYQAYAHQDEDNWTTTERLLRLLAYERKSEALELFARRALKAHPNHALFVHQKLVAALDHQKKTKEALEAAKAAHAACGEAMNGDLGLTMWRRALALADEGKADEGRGLIDAMLDLAATSRHLLWAANFQCHRLKDESKARALYTRGLELAPDDGYLHGNLGVMLYRRGDHEDALEHLRRACDVLPKSSWARENLANCLLEMRRGKDAENVLFEGIEAIVDPTGCLHFLGHVYHDFGRFDDAVAAFEAALKCQPTFIKLYHDLAKVERDRGDRDAARAHVDAALAAAPEDAVAHVAALELALSQDELSTDELARIGERVVAALEAHPKNHHLRLLAGRHAARRGDVERAERALRDVLSESPYDDAGWFLLGSSLLESGRAEEALAPLREAVVRNVNHRHDRYERLAAAQRACGDEEGARETEARAEQSAAQMAKERDSLRGFGAAPTWRVPANEAPPPATPRSEAQASAIIEEAVFLLDAVDTDPLVPAFLEHEVRELDIAAMRERIRRLEALDPSLQGFNMVPNRVRLRDLRFGETLLEALEADAARLREAGTKLFGRIPAFRLQQVVCEMHPIRWRSLFSSDHAPDDYTVVDFADSRHQFEDFDEKLETLDDYPRAVWMQGWLNGLEDFPQDSLVLPALRIAQLAANRFTTIPAALRALPALEVLDLQRNPIAELPEDLSSLRALRHLDVRHTQLSDEQVARLRSALPDCYVARHDQGKIRDRFELVDAVRNAVIHGDDVIFDAVLLPADVGDYILAARADFDDATQAACVMFYDSATHEGQVWRRDPTGLWRDRTLEVRGLRPAFPVAPSKSALTEPHRRLDYERSIHRVRDVGLLPVGTPAMPARMPTPVDDGAGLSFFRTRLDAVDLRGLTLPRTFFCYSELAGTSFDGSDLSESHLCWNDVLDVHFRCALLRNADLRASIYERVSFAYADLSGADLRRSTFHECSFEGARMVGTKLSHAQKAQLSLSAKQHAAIAWSKDAGPAPVGG
ncbi:MAG: tetratricopeptide repeat protein [Myxococcota bacterium]|nr:tetratricopeptide repeat protein [Myxococcota bacterium]